MKGPRKGSAGLDLALIAGYVLLSLAQLVAIHDGLWTWMGMGEGAAALVSLPLAFFPGAGAIVASLGAMTAWGWSGLGAFGLFLGLTALLLLYAVRSGLIGVIVRHADDDD